MILKLENTTTHQTYEYSVDDMNNGEKLYFRFNINTLSLDDGEYNLTLLDGDKVVCTDMLKIGDFNPSTLQYKRGENTYIAIELDAKIGPKNAQISDVSTVIYPNAGYDGMDSVIIDAQPLYDIAFEDGNVIGYNTGKQVQKELLEPVTITENGTYSREDGYSVINVEVPDLNGSFDEGYQQGKEDGYDIGREDGYNTGKQEQKELLEPITITENGVYSRENGYSRVTVEVPDLNGSYDDGYSDGIEFGYNTGYDAGIAEGTANAGEIIAETARVLNITENGIYTSKYSQDGDYPKPDVVTGVFDDGKEFYNYASYKYHYQTNIIPTLNTRLEFWIKDTKTTEFNNTLFVGVDSIGSNDFYFGKAYTQQKYIAKISDSNIFIDQTDEWMHIIMSVEDGLWINNNKIGDFNVTASLSTVTALEIGLRGGGSAPLYGMIKINNETIIPDEFGLFNITTGEYLSKPIDTDYEYILTENFTEPIAEGNLIRTINVNVKPKINVNEYGLKFSQSTFKEIPDFFDFEGVTDAVQMFSYCSNLQTIPLIDTSNVTSMYYMFRTCGSLQSIPLIDTSKVTNMERTFSDCGSLQSIPAIDTSNVTNMGRTFFSCGSLQSIPALNAEKMNLSSYGMFGGTLNALTDFGGLIGLKSSSNNNYSFNCCPNLSYQSCINILNGLYDFTGNGETPTSSQGTLKVHSNFLTTVGDEISIATNKGWNITA